MPIACALFKNNITAVGVREGFGEVQLQGLEQGSGSLTRFGDPKAAAAWGLNLHRTKRFELLQHHTRGDHLDAQGNTYGSHTECHPSPGARGSGPQQRPRGQQHHHQQAATGHISRTAIPAGAHQWRARTRGPTRRAGGGGDSRSD